MKHETYNLMKSLNLIQILNTIFLQKKINIFFILSIQSCPFFFQQVNTYFVKLVVLKLKFVKNHFSTI